MNVRTINNHKQTVHALMVAAGKGSRFGADRPKQYLPLLGKSVLWHSVQSLDVPWIDELTLVVASDDEWAGQMDFGVSLPIYFAVGGAERWQSVQNGVCAIAERGGRDDDWVLIHDAARPCLPYQDLAKLEEILSTTKADGVILATPVVDTLKQVQHGVIAKTVDRSELWQAQTPQVFRLGALQAVLEMVRCQNLMITDEASAFEMLGKTVQVVAGSKQNMKLTYADDLPLLSLIRQSLDG